MSYSWVQLSSDGAKEKKICIVSVTTECTDAVKWKSVEYIILNCSKYNRDMFTDIQKDLKTLLVSEPGLGKVLNSLRLSSTFSTIENILSYYFHSHLFIFFFNFVTSRILPGLNSEN